MVEAKQIQDSRVQIVDVQAIVDGVQAELVGGADARPPRTPPPASHIVKP